MIASMLASVVNTQQLETMMTAAGPGSGKTFTLVERIIFLLSEKVLTPEPIMVVTFIDKAAQKLTTRTSKQMSAGAELQHLDSIEANQMWHQNRYEDVFNGHQV